MIGSRTRGFWRWQAPGGWRLWVHWSCPLFALGLSTMHARRMARQVPELSPGSRLSTALVAGCLPLASMLLHELGHVVAARCVGLRPRAVILTPFAAATIAPEDPSTPARQLAFALAGPAANLGLAALALATARLAAPGPIRGLALMASWLNTALGLSNLIPSPPLDGGLGTHAWRWYATGDRALAERQSQALGQMVGGSLLGLAAAEASAGRRGFRLAVLATAGLTSLVGPALARRLGPDPFGVMDKP
ncbi:MAG: hypothetical protein HY690_03705 [Chloroflexi bacterium]|nr:hypothetical protein [Chloroflexota bacterium]